MLSAASISLPASKTLLITSWLFSDPGKSCASTLSKFNSIEGRVLSTVTNSVTDMPLAFASTKYSSPALLARM